MLLSAGMTVHGTEIAAEITKNKKLETLFQKPLIIGASVSGDRRAYSPGKKLALNYTTLKNIKTIFRKGSGGFKILQDLKESDIKESTIIIALDLFFWDSTLKSSLDLSLKELDRLTDLAKKHKIPLVLGEIPNLIAGFQPARQQLNDAIRNKCKLEYHCYELHLENLWQQLVQQGYIEYNGRQYKTEDLLPDGLHLSSIGSEILAEKIKTLLEPLS